MKHNSLIWRIRNVAIPVFGRKNYSYAAYLFARTKNYFQEKKNQVIDEIPINKESLIYISQNPRAGGTLLRNLFDNHQQIHCFPEELSWEKHHYNWKYIKNNKKGYRILSNEHWTHTFTISGYKDDKIFSFNHKILRKIFFASEKSNKECLNHYFKAFFTAWADYPRSSKKKKYVVAFCPRNKTTLKSIESFFLMEPRGFRIFVLRDPRSWWCSERFYGHRDKKKLLKKKLSFWLGQTKIALEASKKHNKFIIVNFDDLVQNREEVMRKIAKKINIKFSEILTRPTVAGRDEKPNTSFKKSKPGIQRWKDNLSDKEIKYINNKCMQVYRNALKRAI